MLLVLVLGALAGPARCVASWTPPGSATCALRGALTAAAAGPSEAAATRTTRAQLDAVVALAGVAQRARGAVTDPAAYGACEALARKEAHVECFADASLADEALCFATLGDAECWDGTVVEVEGVGWRMHTQGREALCKAVDARLVASGWSELEKRRAVCAASCEARATVRCLGD